MPPILVIGLALLLGGCLGRDIRPAVDAPVAPSAIDAAEPAVPAVPTAVQQPVTAGTPRDRSIWTRLRNGLQWQHRAHPRVTAEIRRLQHNPNAFRALMARSEPYLYHILNAIEQADLPTELALLPAVESGFQPHVHSHEGAAGLWQFMPATGHMLGLRQDWWFDRRRMVRASTEAAIVYLKRLNARFQGDWLHALAAYNAGAGTVSKAIRHANKRGAATDFWSLQLPAETTDYIPRLLALAAVVSDPAGHGLELPVIDDRPFFAVADTGGQLDLNVAAELAGLRVDELLMLNAGHRRWSSHPDGPHELLLPVERVAQFHTALAKLPGDKRLRWQHHRISRGETLGGIARRHGVSVAAIRHANGLKDSRIQAGGDLRIPLSDNVTVASAQSNRQARQRLRYSVRKGDSLYAISRRFDVSIADLKRWNRVGRHIRPGERLTVYIDPDALATVVRSGVP